MNKYEQQLKEGFTFQIYKKFPEISEDLRMGFIDAAPACNFEECLAYSNYEESEFTPSQLKEVKKLFTTVRLHAISLAVQCLQDNYPDVYLDYMQAKIEGTTNDFN